MVYTPYVFEHDQKIIYMTPFTNWIGSSYRDPKKSYSADHQHGFRFRCSLILLIMRCCFSNSCSKCYFIACILSMDKRCIADPLGTPVPLLSCSSPLTISCGDCCDCATVDPHSRKGANAEAWKMMTRSSVRCILLCVAKLTSSAKAHTHILTWPLISCND